MLLSVFNPNRDNPEQKFQEIFAYYGRTKVNDPATATGAGEENFGQGQSITYIHRDYEEQPFRVHAVIHTKVEGNVTTWTSQAQANSQWGGSRVEVYTGIINGLMVQIDNKEFIEKPYTKEIDSSMFKQNNAFGVVLRIENTRASLEGGTPPKSEIVFRTLTRISRAKLRRIIGAGGKPTFDLNNLWNGTNGKGGNARGLLNKDSTKRQWTGDKSVGELLLAIITPPPSQVIQVVTRNINYGIYCTNYSTHKHTFWG